MRIAHLGPSNQPILFDRGGAVERRIAELARVQALNGHSVTVYSAEEKDGETMHNGYRLRALACAPTGVLRRFEFARRAAADLRRRPADRIHVHNAPEAIWFMAGMPATRILSYDYFRSRGWSRFPFYPLYRMSLNRYRYLLPVSEHCGLESARFWGLTGHRMRVVPNGVNLDQFRPDPAAAAAKRKSLGLGEAPVLLSVGRVCRQKGTDVLVEAYAALKRRIPDLCLVVAGPAERFGNTGSSPLVNEIRAVGGVYLGAVEESELAAIYNLATIFVMPTRADEMFGMAAIEAQACGKPVVCSRQGGLPEVITPASGLLTAAGDPRALAEALERLLADEALYGSLASSARANAERFRWERVAEQLDDLCAAAGERGEGGSMDGRIQFGATAAGKQQRAG